MQITPIEIGSVVRSTAGRDAGRNLLVIAIPDEEFVLLADGKLRTVAKPKKKKIRHIKTTGITVAEAAGNLTDAAIRKWLSNEEEL